MHTLSKNSSISHQYYIVVEYIVYRWNDYDINFTNICETLNSDRLILLIWNGSSLNAFGILRIERMKFLFRNMINRISSKEIYLKFIS